MPQTKQQPSRQHTVRFRTPEESRLAAIMAAAAGVSTSEWIATAARERMLDLIENGYRKTLDLDLDRAYKKTLEAHLGDATEPEDIPALERGEELEEVANG